MIEPTTLNLSGERLLATYEVLGDISTAGERAAALCVEQTIEFPADLVPDDDIRRELIGRIEATSELVSEVGERRVRTVVSYAVETTGFELPQLLNVLWGNTSLQPDVRLVDVDLPTALLNRFRGPRFGREGLRELFGAKTRPILATALKPMGLSAERLAESAYQVARGGIDVIKDDHSLANQEFAPFRERVERCADAVRRANAESGFRSVYMPSVNAPMGALEDRVDAAVAAGAGALLVLPGLTGFDSIDRAAELSGLPIMTHPAMLGSYTASPTSGLSHGMVYGTLMRLAGADWSVYPNYGGRFSFTEQQCTEIANALNRPMGALATAFPAPGGGMTLNRVDEIVQFYGGDATFLIGGDLHRGDDLYRSAEKFRSAVENG